MERNCDLCKKEYIADPRNIKRGWGLTCSKSCAAKKRERAKPNYNPAKVAHNNRKRAGLLSRAETGYYNRVEDDRDYDEPGWDDHKNN